MRTFQPHSRHAGFTVLEIVLSMVLITLIFGAMMGSYPLQQRAMQTLSDRRAAIRLAEQTLTQLQTRQPVTFNENIRLEPLESHSATLQWCRVHVTLGRSSATLTGLVPQVNPSTAEAR